MALEPITRKEKIIAGQDLTPITRLEKFLKQFGGGGGGAADDVYLIKHIENYDAQKIEIQGDYAGALSAFNSGKRLKFVKAIVYGGQEFVDCESFAYYFDSIDSFFIFAYYNGHNFLNCTLRESGLTIGSDDTRVSSLIVNNYDQLYLKSNSSKLFRIKVSDTGELSTEEVRKA